MYRKIAQHPTTRADLRAPPGRGAGAERGRRAGAVRRVPGAARRGARGRGRLQDEQGRLARGRLVRPRAARPSSTQRGSTAVPTRAAARGRPRDDRRSRRASRPPQAQADHRPAPPERSRAAQGIDWATAEHLAFGSLLLEGYPVRLSGQDSGRGTFSQRHAILYDQNDGSATSRSTTLDPEQAPFEVRQQPARRGRRARLRVRLLARRPEHAGAVGGAVRRLRATARRWIIDQFIAVGRVQVAAHVGARAAAAARLRGPGARSTPRRGSSVSSRSTPRTTSRWSTPRRRRTTSTRCAARCTAASASRSIVMTPKSLLRHKRCVSQLADMGPGSSFHRVMYERAALQAEPDVTRVVLCSGKVYYDLVAARQELGLDDVRRCCGSSSSLRSRPTPGRGAARAIRHRQLVWCQEEPQNMGAWSSSSRASRRCSRRSACARTRPGYAGRPTAASPATGARPAARARAGRAGRDAR